MRACIRLAPVFLAAAVVLSATASAQIDPTIVDMTSGYACEGTRVVDDNTSTAGDQLVIVGTIPVLPAGTGFFAPFDDLNSSGKEYTYVYDGLTSLGTATIPLGPFFQYITDYSGGSLRIYCDDPAGANYTPADFANKASFGDGECILEMSLANFQIVTDTISCSGSQNADVTFTGGTLLSRLSGCPGGVITGLFSTCSAVVPGARQAEGYFGLSDTKIDPSCPVPVEEATWGSIKLELGGK